MTSHLIEFQGINALDKSLVEMLKHYLQEKESQLGHSILKSIHTLSNESLPPVLPYSTGGMVSLSDAVDGFRKNIKCVGDSKKPLVSSNDWQLATRLINSALWEYTEVLEGCVVELFQQLGQVGFEEWDAELISVVETIKELLTVKMSDLAEKLKKLESLLWSYRTVCENKAGKGSSLLRVLMFWKTLLDRSLKSYLRKSKKFLRIKYQWFTDRYNDYLGMKQRVEGSVKKFKKYQIFNSLDEGFQDGFRKIYQLLKLWKLNEKVNALPEREPTRALRSAFSMEKVNQLFTSYYTALRKALFDKSMTIKGSEGKTVSVSMIQGYRAELHTLGASIASYRDFFLGTHPNPYIRKRWGFAEWIVGPEPGQTRDMLHLMYSIENLDKLYEKFGESLGEKVGNEVDADLSKHYREIQETLHEMGEPLTSRVVLRSRAEKVLYQIEQMDELGSTNPKVIEYVGKAFSKALRADWQNHVLFEIQLFHQLFEIHQGLVPPIETKSHLNRLQKFKQVINELNEWVKSRETHRHALQIEARVKEVKKLFQEFNAEVQATPEADVTKKSISAIANQLLEYSYIFGTFFSNLHQSESEGKIIRNQFLFIDQNFEAAENRLHELSALVK